MRFGILRLRSGSRLANLKPGGSARLGGAELAALIGSYVLDQFL
jgi:hypothetical protein